MKSDQFDEQLAASCVVSIMAGLVLPGILATTNLERAIAFWFASCILVGLIVGQYDNTIKLRIKALIPSIFLNASWFLYILVRAAADMIKGKQAFAILFQSTSVNVSMDIYVLFLLFFLCLTACIATWVLVLLSAKGNVPISRMLSHLYDFGPDGINRINKILIALMAVVTAFYALWSSLWSK